MTALSSVAWQQGQNKPAVVGMLPVWPISQVSYGHRDTEMLISAAAAAATAAH